jgi:hypothetical protein
MAPPPPEFDQLHIISDVHMGGRKGSQIFDQGPLLASLIDSLGAAPGASTRWAPSGS